MEKKKLENFKNNIENSEKLLKDILIYIIWEKNIT